MADVKWIKIATDIFENDKFDAIEALPDGMMIELVWLKLLCLAGKCNYGGMLVIADEIPYTDEMLAKRFHMEIGVIQRAIEQFERLGMIEVVDSVYAISNWSRYQNTDRLEKIREKDRIRQRQKRLEKKVHGKSVDASDGNALISISNSISNNNSISNSICNEEDRGVGEEETEQKKELKRQISDVIDYLNAICGTRYHASTKANEKYIGARLNEGFTVDDCKHVIDVKHEEWSGDPKMEKFLRPTTLFAPEHFEEYLNQKMKKPASNRFSVENFV